MLELLYAIADGVLALVSFWLAYEVRLRLYHLRPLFPVTYYIWVIPLAVGLWLIVGWVTGLYHAEQEGVRRAIWGPVRVAVISTILLFALIFAFDWHYISRILLGLYAGIDLALMIALRLAAWRWRGRIASSVAGYRYFLMIGGAAEAGEIARMIESNESRGMRLAGFALASADAEAMDQSRLRRRYPVYRLDELADLLHRHVIDEAVFAVRREEIGALDKAFLLCEQEGVRTRLCLNFLPHVISRVSLERLQEMPLLTFSTTPENEYLMLSKRIADFVMSAALVVVCSPLLLVLSALVKLTSRGPILYRQTRCGLGGRKFTLYKFRSMREGADLYKTGLESLNEMDGPVFKMKNDPRCTPVGRLMRRLSLDELPQLFNILKGDMSFVGPRPPIPAEVERYEGWQRRRLRMRPGLTCLWAVKGRNRLNFRRWMELDLEYIDHWSPLLDWKILLKTIPAVLLGRGAF